MAATTHSRQFAAFASGLVVALIAVAALAAWRVDAAPGDTDATYVPITPCRLFDTRPAYRAGPFDAFGPNETRTIVAHGAQGQCAIPADANGLSTNATAIDASEPTFLTFWPDGQRPNASSLNPVPGQPPTPNAVNVSLSPTGAFNVYNLAGSVHLIVDITGYYTDSSLDEIQARLTVLEGAQIVNASGDQDFTLTSPKLETVRSVLLTTSTPGTAAVTASGWSYLTTTGEDFASCSITNGPEILSSAHNFRVYDFGIPAARDYAPFSSTRAFPVAAGTTTFRLVCQEQTGGVILRDTEMTVVFIPTP